MECPSCRQRKWIEFDEGFYCESCQRFIIKQKHQTDQKIRRQDKTFSERLPFVNKKIKGRIFSCDEKKCKTLDGMIRK